MKDEMKKIEYEDYDSAAKVYDRYRQTPGHSSVKALISSLSEKKPSILEVGCGTGNYLAKIAEDFPDANVFGLDLNNSMLDRCREKTAHLKNVKQLICEAAQNLPFEDNSMDLIMAMQTLHHYGPDENRIQFFKEVNRVLKPGGRFLLDHSTNIQLNLFWFVFLCPYGLEKGYETMRSNSQYIEMCKKVGLSHVSTEEIYESTVKDEIFLNTKFFLEKEAMKCDSTLNMSSDKERKIFHQIVEDLSQNDTNNVFTKTFKTLVENYGTTTHLVFKKD